MPQSGHNLATDDCTVIQRFVDRNLANGHNPSVAFQKARLQLCLICEFDWESIHFDPVKKRVLARAETPTSTSKVRDHATFEDGDAIR